MKKLIYLLVALLCVTTLLSCSIVPFAVVSFSDDYMTETFEGDIDDIDDLDDFIEIVSGEDLLDDEEEQEEYQFEEGSEESQDDESDTTAALVTVDESKNVNVSDYVIDEAGILSQKEEKKLAQYFSAIEEARQCSVIVVTKSEIDGDIESYTDDFYDYGGYGYGDDHAGVMMLLDLSQRDYWITTTGDEIIFDLQPYIDDMGEAFLEGLDGSDNFYAGFKNFGEVVDLILSGQFKGMTDADDDEDEYEIINYVTNLSDNTGGGFSLPKIVIICIAVGFILSLVTCLAIRSRNKSVKFNKAAENYIKPGSFQINHQRDTFLYHTVSRTKIANDNNNHSNFGGGGGGGIHVGSSGVSHGGGGGHF